VEQSVRLSEQGAAGQPTGGLSLGLIGFELVSTFWWIACLLENRKQPVCPYIIRTTNELHSLLTR
jgi:hypothetical protein